MAMPMDHEGFQALKARVEAHEFDVASDQVPFSEKLRHQTGWSRARTARAIAEYRRFVILAVAAGHTVSPSKAVDEVWHLHLTDTRRYWDEFCPKVLGRPLHHDPARGGAGEAADLDWQYKKTLQSYARLFGEAPPRDIWPTRAGLLARARQVLRAPASLMALAAPLMLVGCTLVDSSQPGAIQGPEFVWLYVGICITALIVMVWLQGMAVNAGPKARLGQTDLGSYELAYLAGGPARVFSTASGSTCRRASPRPCRPSAPSRR
jgi:hypothetical protein